MAVRFLKTVLGCGLAIIGALVATIVVLAAKQVPLGHITRTPPTCALHQLTNTSRAGWSWRLPRPCGCLPDPGPHPAGRGARPHRREPTRRSSAPLTLHARHTAQSAPLAPHARARPWQSPAPCPALRLHSLCILPAVLVPAAARPSAVQSPVHRGQFILSTGSVTAGAPPRLPRMPTG